MGFQVNINIKKYKLVQKKLRNFILFNCNKIEEFGIYLQYVRKLGFEETPDYDFLRELFNKVLRRMGESDDGMYDWMSVKENRRQQDSTNRLAVQHRKSTHTSVKRHASQPKLSPTPPQPPLPIPAVPDLKMPPSPQHGTTVQPPAYGHNRKEEHRGIWHALMSIMTCGTH
jgi:casein kinase 1